MNHKIIINKDKTLLDALRIMDSIEKKLLVICDNRRFLGVISIGDIQRAILNKQDLSSSVVDFIRPDIIYARDNDSLDYIKATMLENRIESMPIVDSNNLLVNIYEWCDFFGERSSFKTVNCPVVIMAGGMGTRLKPLTNVIPKPLIPVSDKTIIEEIMSKFQRAGCSDFYLSLNYKSDYVKSFFEKRDYKNVSYINEKKPLGTGGSLALLKGILNNTFFVSNCDILVDVNFSDLYEYHKKQKNIATLVSVLKSYSIPYGIIETSENGIISDMKEKPCLTYQINSGVYIIEPHLLDYLNNEETIDLPSLLLRVKSNGEKIGAFPVSEGSWVDMGNWDDYLKLIRSNKMY
ncbi:MAG: CBS domain-containing protein [Pseudobutyrivibrio ruminis]|nr:CBS domain-containing protein [Pseudobutyrivibrio ruminis]